MYDIISIGGGTFDLFVKAHDSRIMRIKNQATEEACLLLPYGGKQKIDEVHETLGGGAHNTSVAFARMGLKSAYCGLIGEDLYGKKILANLEAEGICQDFLSVTEDEKTGFSVILNSFEGERTVLNYVGANHLFGEEHFPVIQLLQTKWIFLNHLSGEANRLIKKVNLVLEQNPKIKLAWNPGGVQLEEGAEKFKKILEKTEVLFLNKEEAEKFSRLTSNQLITQKEISEAYDLSEIFQYFHHLGVKIVVITDGRKGAQCSAKNTQYHCPVYDFKRVDTLGAGDAFASGFTGALILKKDLQTALKFGTINATSVVSYYGAQKGLLKLREIEKVLQKQAIKIIQLK